MIKKFLLVLALLILVTVVSVAGWGTWAYHSVPDFYQEAMAESIPRQERVKAAGTLEKKAKRLVEDLKSPDEFSEEFTQTQINSWLIEVFDTGNPEWRPQEISQPRVRMTKSAVQIGFQYQYDGWDGVASLKLRPYLNGPNQLALEVQDARVGLIPLPLEDVKAKIAEQLSQSDWKITWKKIDGKEVALIDLNQHGEKGPQLDSLDLSDGKVKVRGQGTKPKKSSNAQGDTRRNQIDRVAQWIRFTSG